MEKKVEKVEFQDIEAMKQANKEDSNLSLTRKNLEEEKKHDNKNLQDKGKRPFSPKACYNTSFLSVLNHGLGPTNLDNQKTLKMEKTNDHFTKIK